MSHIPLKLVRQAVIPRDAHTTVRMQREPEPVVVAPVVESEPVPPPVAALPAGTDRWYDSPDVAVIPFRTIDAETCPDTEAKDFTVDDDVDDENDAVLSIPALASAWWQLTTPDDITSATLTLDTWQTRGGLLNAAGDGPATYKTDTNLGVYTTTDVEALPLDPLPTGTVDFSSLQSVELNDDDPEPPGVDFPYLSKVVATLEPGRVYWIRVDTWGGESSPGGGMYFDGITYRLRISLDFS